MPLQEQQIMASEQKRGETENENEAGDTNAAAPDTADAAGAGAMIRSGQASQNHPPRLDTDEDTGQGQVSHGRDGADAEQPAGVPPAREGRAAAANRWIREGIRAEVDLRRDEVRRECLAAGMRRHEALDRAWAVVMAEYPPPGIEPGTVEIPEPPPSEPEPIAVTPAAETDCGESGGVVGIGSIPAGWPILPPNASLQAEVSWVQASRLDVVEMLPGGGARVRLERADRPAPSKAALSWLETAILFPAKFADVSLRATQHAEDAAEHERRERAGLEAARSLLADMCVVQ